MILRILFAIALLSTANLLISEDACYLESERVAGSREIFPRPWDTVFYPSSTIAYCYVTINGVPASAGDEVGAFINGECRGVGVVFIMGSNATTFFCIQGTMIETVQFNLWDESANEVLEISYITQTNPGGDIGYPPNQLPLDATGLNGEAEITAIADVPFDEGGWVQLVFNASKYDSGVLYGEEYYRVYCWLDNDWQLSHELSATAEENYSVILATAADSTADNLAIYSYIVEAVMQEGVWLSEAVDGYSVDNLAPAAPEGLEFTAGYLIWAGATEQDFAEYWIFLDNEYWQSSIEPEIDMISVIGEMSVEALDIHGNRSERSVSLWGGFLYGDVDHNLIVEAYDASLVLQYFCNLEPEGAPLPWPEWRENLANVDGSEQIEAYDAALILRFALGMIDHFPVER